ncbi:MAG: HPP family protein [Pseudobdellovibrionaceae bacterium]
MTSVKTVMSHRLIAVPLGTPIEKAERLMREKRIRHLPVIDEEDVVVGVISQRDLIGVRDPKTEFVELAMKSPVQSIPGDWPLRKAVFEMLEKKISCLLVSDPEDMAVGILTTDDLLWFLASHLPEEEKEKAPILSADRRLTIGEVANELSMMGI